MRFETFGESLIHEKKNSFAKKIVQLILPISLWKSVALFYFILFDFGFLFLMIAYVSLNITTCLLNVNKILLIFVHYFVVIQDSCV